MPDLPRFAFTPAGMDADAAAFYLGVGKHAFLGQVAAGEAPQPIQVTPRCKVWLREDLDRYIAVLTGAAGRIDWLNPHSARPNHNPAATGGW